MRLDGVLGRFMSIFSGHARMCAMMAYRMSTAQEANRLKDLPEQGWGWGCGWGWLTAWTACIAVVFQLLTRSVPIIDISRNFRRAYNFTAVSSSKKTKLRTRKQYVISGKGSGGRVSGRGGQVAAQVGVNFVFIKLLPVEWTAVCSTVPPATRIPAHCSLNANRVLNLRHALKFPKKKKKKRNKSKGTAKALLICKTRSGVGSRSPT